MRLGSLPHCYCSSSGCYYWAVAPAWKMLAGVVCFPSLEALSSAENYRHLYTFSTQPDDGDHSLVASGIVWDLAVNICRSPRRVHGLVPCRYGRQSPLSSRTVCPCEMTAILGVYPPKMSTNAGHQTKSSINDILRRWARKRGVSESVV
jgi:hypothetical protein